MLKHALKPKKKAKNSVVTEQKEKESSKPQRKPRRHTTGGGKQTIEDVKKAKELAALNNNNTQQQDNENIKMSDPTVIDGTTTLGRKQLISMLKQRYGSEIENYRNSSENTVENTRETEKMNRSHWDHNNHNPNRSPYDNRELYRNGGVANSPAVVRSNQRQHHSNSSSLESSPKMQRAYVTRGASVRRNNSNGSGGDACNSLSGNSDTETRPQHTKRIAFLQLREEVKRVNLPPVISSLETIKALFVGAFPNKVAMPHFESGLKHIYIKDIENGVYYQLENTEDVLNRSFLKIHENEEEPASSIAYSSHHQSWDSLPDRNDSLHDFELGSPRVRTNSGSSSVRSDGLTTRSDLGLTSRSLYMPKSNYNYIENNSVRVANTAPASRQQQQLEQHQQHILQQQKQRQHQQQQYNNQPYNHGQQPQHSSQQQHYNNNSAPLSPTFSKKSSLNYSERQVEEQLSELTDLLHTALDTSDTTAEYDGCVNIKNPGKLNRDIIDGLQQKTEELSHRNVPLPAHFQPTVIVKAQEETITRRTQSMSSESSSSDVFVHPPLHSNRKPGIEEEEKIKSTENLDQSEAISLELLEQLYDLEEEVKGHQSSIRERQNSFRGTPKKSVVKSTPAKTSVPKIKITTSSSAKPQQNNSNKEQEQQVPPKQSQQIRQHQPQQQQKPEAPKSYQQQQNNQQQQQRQPQIQQNNYQHQQIQPHQNHYKQQQPKQQLYKEEQIQPQQQHNNYQQQPEKQLFENPSEVNHTSQTNGEKPPTTSSQQNEQQNDPNNKNMVYDFPTSADHQEQADLLLESLARPIYSKNTNDEEQQEDTPPPPKPKKTPASPSQGQVCKPPSVTTPDFIELEDSAQGVKQRLVNLRQELSDMRRIHVENSKHFKADIQKKLLLFRKKAARVDDFLQDKFDTSSNCFFANAHPVRERRHRLTADQIEYNSKRSSTTESLTLLETRMENFRMGVVTKKCVENPEELERMREELTTCARGLSEVKNRYHGLVDMVEKVTAAERGIIENEESFLKVEPDQLDQMIARCKALTETLVTLERLATVQTGTKQRQQPHQQQQDKQQPYQQQTRQQQPYQQNQLNRSQSQRYKTYADSGIM